MTMATRPSRTGRNPLSPPRTRTHQILTYSPKESAMTSGEARATSGVISSVPGAASGVGSTSVLTGAPWGRLGRRRGQAPGGARGHQVDDGLVVELLRRPLGGDPAQPHHGYPVGHRLHVVQVMGDDDDGDVLAL